MISDVPVLFGDDHCRIGSLEMLFISRTMHSADHCRIGSLENNTAIPVPFVIDHCRIGSLESKSAATEVAELRSLPHRQLRKATINKKEIKC